ncbi:MAG: hypothetical protein U9N51_01150, partial [Bacteroidota bacterium]|nr:hypothetical protein [Bacteroidota bacterium]
GQVLSSTSTGTQWAKAQILQSNSASVTAGNWYRIASNSGNRADASFTLRDQISGGGHSTMRFHAGVNYGNAGGISFNLLSHSKYSTATFTKVRIIEADTYDGAYLEVYCNRSGAVEYDMYDNLQSSGWTPVDWTAGSIPGGWTANEYETDRVFAVGASDDLLSLTHGGDFGVGTGTPSEKLDIYGDSENIEITNTAETDAGIILNDAQATTSQYAEITYGCGDNDLNFLNASATPRMVIESSGEVGIGTVSPNDKLDVVGNAQVSGYMKVGSPSAPTSVDRPNTELYRSTFNDYEYYDWTVDNHCGSSAWTFTTYFDGDVPLQRCLHFENNGGYSRKYMLSPWVWIPTGSTNVYAQGHNWCGLENNYDGVFLEYKTYGGSWTKITSFSSGGYPDNANGSNTSCNGTNSQSCWNGEMGN